MDARLKWSHALVTVRDFDATVDFYTNVLGFHVTDRDRTPDGTKELVFMSQSESEHHQIAFLSGKTGEPTKRPEGLTPNRTNHFAFRVDNLDDVKAWWKKLSTDDRVEGAMPWSHGNTFSVYFFDPEGNGLEIFCDTPWHVAQPSGAPWDPTASDEEIHETARQRLKDNRDFKPIDEFYADLRSQLEG